MSKEILRHLYLVRHAKSSWKTGHTDFDRPLNKRGLDNAPEMGRRLAGRNIKPDLLVSSPALRARTTAELIAQAIGYDSLLIELRDELYLASVSDWMRVIYSLPEECRTVMLFGHNPGITELVQQLANLGIDNMPTCSVVGLSIQMEPDHDSWALFEHASLLSSTFDFPKNTALPIISPQ